MIYCITLKQKQRKGRQYDVISKRVDADVFSVCRVSDIMLSTMSKEAARGAGTSASARRNPENYLLGLFSV